MSPVALAWALASGLDIGLRLAAQTFGGVVPEGKPVGSAEAPLLPTATPLTPGPGDLGTNSIAPVLVGGNDISLLVLILAGIFAAVGFIRGSRREFPAFALILPSYLLFSRGWPLVASLINKVWQVLHLALVERAGFQVVLNALLGQDGGPGPLIGVSAEAPMAQIATFGLAMLIIYMATRGGPEANGLERLVGAVIGAGVGYLAGVFVLSRIVPSATVTLLSPGSTALTWLGRLGPMAALLLVGATILFGFRSLGPGAGGARKRYG